MKEILEGKTMPVSVTYGLGGEGGYEQFTSQDPELISELITTFREMKIQEEVTDRDKMIFFDDAIEDYIFVLDNGVQVMVTLDAGYVAYGENVQYLFESSKGLTKFKNEIRESGSAEYDSAIWIIYSDTTHVGRKSYSLTKYNGIDKVVDAFDINCEYQGDNYDENSDFHIRDEKVTMEEFEKIMMELFD